ncbi:MAG TPA: hypothetical protein VFW94_03720, partial [Candidatus Acidoferrales bacterium]|nr:hypothetical protein [Candidatus Acidoferrales bacterium]
MSQQNDRRDAVNSDTDRFVRTFKRGDDQQDGRPWKRMAVFGTVLGLLMAAGLVPARAGAQKLAAGCPPKAQTDDVVDVLHGVRVADPYRWLEDQQSAQTRAWINAEDVCTKGVLDSLADRKTIADRLAELMHTESVDVPLIRGGRLFYMKRAPNEDLSLLYTRDGANGREELLVDPRPLSPDHSTSVS